MKVLWLGPSPLLPTGLGKVTRYITTGLAELGYDVSIGSFQHMGEPIEVEGVKHYPLTSLDLLPLVLNEVRPDVVIAYGSHWYPTIGGITPVVVKRGYKLIWHCTVEWSFVSLVFLEPLLGCNMVVTPSEHGRNVISRHIPPERVSVIPHGVNHSIFKPIRPRPRVVGYENKFVFGTVMRNNLRKEYSVIIRAFASLPDHIRENSILYVHAQPVEFTGDKPGWDLGILTHMFGLQGKVVCHEKAVKYFGLREDMMARVYSALDVHMLISSGEGFGLPAAESLACGVPNICSKNTALPEVAGPGALYAECWEEEIMSSEGFGLHTTKISAVRDCMVMLYENEKLRRKLAREGKRHVSAFTWERSVAMFSKLIDMVANEMEAGDRIKREMIYLHVDKR